MKIEYIWNDILKHEGEVFQTARGIRFTYKVLNDHEIQPGTEFSKKIIGSSYVAGILNDKRIGA